MWTEDVLLTRQGIPTYQQTFDNSVAIQNGQVEKVASKVTISIHTNLEQNPLNVAKSMKKGKANGPEIVKLEMSNGSSPLRLEMLTILL